MRPFLATYALADGQRQMLPIVARSTFDAIDVALDTFGTELRYLSVRPA